jgi:hypothetical protein
MIAGTDQRNDVGRFGGEFVCQFLVVGNKVGDVNVTVVLLDKDILTELVTDIESTSFLSNQQESSGIGIPVDERIIQLEL